VDERPWVRVHRIELPRFSRPDQHITFRIVLHNVGRSAALAVDPSTMVFLNSPSAPFPPMQLRVCHQGGCQAAATQRIAPRAQQTLELTRTLSPADYQRLEDGSALMYVYGSVAYRDTAGTARQTTFCYASSRSEHQPPQFSFHLCDRRNEER
jgi:hypothetical protein